MQVITFPPAPYAHGYIIMQTSFSLALQVPVVLYSLYTAENVKLKVSSKAQAFS